MTEALGAEMSADMQGERRTGVGQELAAAREARGLALADVAQQLKFAPRQLEALEQEHFDQLPGATFARGMVRAYARLLKLDPEPLVQRVSGRFEVPDSNRLAARYHQPVPFSDSARRSTFVYLAVSLGVLVLVGGVAYEWHQERTAAATKKTTSVAQAKSAPPREANPQESQPRTAPVVPPVPVQQATAPVAAQKPVVQEKKPAAVAEKKLAAAVPEKKPAAAVPEKKPAAAPEKPVLAAAAPAVTAAPVPRPGPNRLVVRTEGEAWIEIKDAADRMLVSSLNPPGVERVVRGKPPYTVVIGNASNVRITYDDKPIDLAPHTRQDVARLTIP
jgi:cytoskeleton protein RodZ